jgi:hypothetical protein
MFKVLCYISEIVKLAKGENETQLSKMTQSEQDTYEMHVRAANIVSCIAVLVASASVFIHEHILKYAGCSRYNLELHRCWVMVTVFVS